MTQRKEIVLGNNVSQTQRSTPENTKKHFGKWNEILIVWWESILVSTEYFKTRKKERYKDTKNRLKRKKQQIFRTPF